MSVEPAIDAVEKHSNLVAERFIARISNDQIALFDRGKRELKRKGLDLDAQKLVTQNARLARLVRRMQEAKEGRA